MVTNMVQLSEDNPRAALLRLSWEDLKARLMESVLDRLCRGAPGLEEVSTS
jgi:hypothetical protein